MINNNEHNSFKDFKWLTLDQVAGYLQVSKSSIYKLAQTGKIPVYKVGRQWRFEKNEVDDWVRKHKRK